MPAHVSTSNPTGIGNEDTSMRAIKLHFALAIPIWVTIILVLLAAELEGALK